MKVLRQVKLFRFILLALSIVIAVGCNKNDEQSYDEIRFNSKLDYGSVTDIDGNTYRTIQIGSQVWMAENLKVARYSDATAIPLVQDSKQWISLQNDGYCKYEKGFDINGHLFIYEYNYEVYGYIYNYYAAVSVHNVCPAGWHLPDNSDWRTIGIYLGGEEIAGKKLKEAGPVHWGYYNTLSTNESGFTALPGGLRDYLGIIESMGDSRGGSGFWWSATVNDPTSAWSYNLGSEVNTLMSFPIRKREGQNVRCVKD
jgi:uncharacterized protein (TIGR02145 family)